MELKKRTWDQITITDWKRIRDISQRELDSDMEKDIACLAVLCEVSEDEIYSLSLTELRALLVDMEWIKKPFTFNHNFRAHKIKIDGDTYNVEPDIDKFTVAQYLDYQTLWENKEEHMGSLLSVFIIPKGCKYNEGYDIQELAQKLEDSLSIKFWNEVCFFFLINSLTSVKASLAYSLWLTKKERRRTKDKEAKMRLKEKERELQEKLKQLLPIG